VKKLTEEYIISRGWVKSTWFNNHLGFIHKKFNMVNDSFYIELKINLYDFYSSIVEENNHLGTQIIFSGHLKTESDLDKIMELLEFDFD
jgi:hypothetical protein